MAKFVLTYRGGKMAENAEDAAVQMEAWGAWFGTLGPKITDMGAPFGESASIGAVAAEGLSGYSILEANSLSDAKSAAANCPVLGAGGSIDIYETIEM
jgi:hypothetical protein